VLVFGLDGSIIRVKPGVGSGFGTKIRFLELKICNAKPADNLRQRVRFGMAFARKDRATWNLTCPKNENVDSWEA
jgi:hypothetical protein